MSGSNLGSLRQSRGVLPAMVPTFRRYPDRGGITNARQSTDLLLVAIGLMCAIGAFLKYCRLARPGSSCRPDQSEGRG
jgi:hypothetical protein